MTDDVLDVSAVPRALWGARWRLVVAALCGAMFGGLLLLILPRRWEARATVLASPTETSGGMGRAGVSEALTSVLLGGPNTGVETELELLRAEHLLRDVSRQLSLAVRMERPATLSPQRLLSAFEPQESFAPLDATIERTGNQWRLRTHAGTDTIIPFGGTAMLPVGVLRFHSNPPPEVAAATFTLLDEEDLFRLLKRRVTVERVGGEVAAVTARWDDSLSGAHLVNGIVDGYLRWRRDTDREKNTLVSDFLRAKSDSTAKELALALDALRRFLEKEPFGDPSTAGSILVSALTRVRSEEQTVSTEQMALDNLLHRLEREDGPSARELPTFPAFQRSPALNELLGDVLRLETERTNLLATRTPSDPSVQALSASINRIDAQLLPLARSYRSVLMENERSLRREADSLRRQLAQVPGAGRRYTDLTAEVDRLVRSRAVMETQLLQLRLAEVGEGAGVRAIDRARPSRRPASPVAPLLIGGGAGFALLVMAALVLLRAAPRLRPPPT